jgi:hypothetical protein
MMGLLWVLLSFGDIFKRYLQKELGNLNLFAFSAINAPFSCACTLT